MPFISNSDNITLGDGVYNNVHGNLNVYNVFCGKKRRRPEVEDGPHALSLPLVLSKRRRSEEPESRDGLKIIRTEHLKLTGELGSGPGYFLHAGRNKSRAVIVRVFNAAQTAREQMEATLALSKRLMHPNVLRIEGISEPGAVSHFIAYENAHRKNAESPLAAALNDNAMTSVALGFKNGLSLAGINRLHVQGISLAALQPENFDILLDINDRFLLSINPTLSGETMATRTGQLRLASSRDGSID